MSNSEKTEPKKKKRFSRRKFLVRSSIGLGVVMGATYLTRPLWRRALAGVMNTAEAPYSGNTDDPKVWFEITADNQVTLLSPKVEMGQGTFTGMAQIAADELGVDISQLMVKHAPTAGGNVDPFATGGSTSISSLWQPLRELAATMREMLLQEAAKQLGIEANTLSVKNGVVSGGGKSVSYGDIVKNVTEWKIPKTPKLKDASEYKFIGKPVPRVDLKDKVLGTPMFGMDASMPDMLFGDVVRPSQIDATYVGADTSAAEKMPGVVKIVKEKDFVGVVAKSITEARNAKKAIKAEWKINKAWQNSDIEEIIKVGKGTAYNIQKEGSPNFDDESTITSEYTSPIGAHAQLEPNGAVAHVADGKATIMISTQVVNITRSEIAERLGFDTEDVNIIPTFLGGGFGRRLHTANGIQAALLSKAVGKPVKCFFDRKEEFQNDTFRPPTHHVLKAKLNSDGMIDAMEHNVSSGAVAFGSPMLPPGTEAILGADIGAWRGGMINYSKIPNYQAISWKVNLPFATSWWRSLGLLANTFAIESFMDELAIKAGKDPIQFRLDQINDDEKGTRLKKTIEAARDKAGWKDGKLPNGRAMGFACSVDANTPCAHVVEVSVENKKIKVHKVTCSIDPGVAVNPDQIRAQCEGSIIMGMSAAMFEKMEVKDNQLTPTIYGPYKMALMRDAPKEIDVVILENAEAPGAVGEPPLGPIAAAIANAVFRLTDQRLRSMPLELS
ncbi:MAG: molybdopterin cofactor-binding domain-containing protein [Saprospiraceae bacterium]